MTINWRKLITYGGAYLFIFISLSLIRKTYADFPIGMKCTDDESEMFSYNNIVEQIMKQAANFGCRILGFKRSCMNDDNIKNNPLFIKIMQDYFDKAFFSYNRRRQDYSEYLREFNNDLFNQYCQSKYLEYNSNEYWIKILCNNPAGLSLCNMDEDLKQEVKSYLTDICNQILEKFEYTGKFRF